MVVSLPTDESTDLLFGALSDATRRDILTRAMNGEHSVSALARLYPMSFAAVQKHVAVLERAGLVKKEKRGREQLVHTNLEAIEKAQRLLAHFEGLWRTRFDQMGRVLTSIEKGRTK